jgi:RNA polymerase sigma factor (sigma-70 family)
MPPDPKPLNDPFAESSSSRPEPSDESLVAAAREGGSDALDQLVRRHQPWIFNLALRMVWRRVVAEDATQEILLKAVTKLSSFRGQSQFRSWLYRIAVNHLINLRKTTEIERNGATFSDYGRGLDHAPDLDLPDPNTVPVDVNLLVEETRDACMNGMLLCLDRRQRMAFILADIFGVSGKVGAEVMEESPDNFRQLLSRARRDLYQFMTEKCGLVNAGNPCRCARKTSGFMKAGYVDPENLQFTRDRLARIRDVAPERVRELVEAEQRHAGFFREHGFLQPPDFAGKLRELISGAGADVPPDSR